MLCVGYDISDRGLSMKSPIRPAAAAAFALLVGTPGWLAAQAPPSGATPEQLIGLEDSWRLSPLQIAHA